MNIVELKTKTDVVDTLLKAASLYKDADAVIVLAVSKNGQPFITSSSCTGYQKSWMLSAALAQLFSTFGFKRD